MQDFYDHVILRLIYDAATGIFTWRHHPVSRKLNGTVAGGVSSKGYIKVAILGKKYFAHRLAFIMMTGEFPGEGIQVDHIDGDRSNNSWKNLRLATNGQNSQNAKTPITNTTGHKGVVEYRTGWRVQIAAQGVMYSSTHRSLDEAKSAADALRLKLHGEFAKNK